MSAEFNDVRNLVPQNAELEDLARIFAPVGAVPQALAATGSVQGDAASISYTSVNVSAADGTKGVILPTAASNAGPRIVYNSGTGTLKIYPYTSQTINGGSSNAAISLLAKNVAILYPTSATNWAAITGPSTASFSSATLTTATLTGVTVVGDSGNPKYDRAQYKFKSQTSPTAETGTSQTYTAAEIGGGIITSTQTGAVTGTLDTGSNLDTAFSGATTNDSIEWTLINLGSSSGAVTVTASTGHTIVGNAVVAISTSAVFVTRKTGTATWVTYRKS